MSLYLSNFFAVLFSLCMLQLVCSVYAFFPVVMYGFSCPITFTAPISSLPVYSISSLSLDDTSYIMICSSATVVSSVSSSELPVVDPIIEVPATGDSSSITDNLGSPILSPTVIPSAVGNVPHQVVVNNLDLESSQIYDSIVLASLAVGISVPALYKARRTGGKSVSKVTFFTYTVSWTSVLPLFLIKPSVL